MKTFFLAKIALLPFATFWWLHALGHSTLGLAVGTAIAVASLIYRLRIRSTYFLEAVACVTMVFLGAIRALNFHLLSGNEVALSFLFLGLSFGLSVILGRPWTISYSGKSWSDSKESQLFIQINQFISSLWALIFLYLGFSNLFDFLRVATWVPISAGAVISIAFPSFWVRRSLQKVIDSREKYSWISPFTKNSGARSEENLEADVVVVGAGIGGLTAASLLAQAGLRVIVAEQHSVAGGFCHTWIRKITDGDNRLTFRFDAGVHDISGYWQGGPVHGLLERLGLGQKIAWQRLDHRYHSFDGNSTNSKDSKFVDAPRDWNKFVDQAAQKFPQESAEIQELMAKIKEIYEAMYSEAKHNSGVPSGPKSVGGMLAFNKSYPIAVKWLKQPFMELLRSHLKSPEAQNSFLDLASYITDNPEKLTVAQMVPLFGYNLHGGHYPIGGSGCLSSALVSAIENRGGRVWLRTPVNKIIIENGLAKGVTFANGQSLRAKAVIANGDFLQATHHLVDPSAFPHEFNSTINQLEPSCSAFLVNLGVRGNFENVKPITHVKTPQGNIGIVIPSLVDPSAAPEGYHSVELIRLLSKEEASSWFSDPTETDDKAFRASALYKSRKATIGDEMIRMAEMVIPGLSERIVLRTDASPATFRRYAWSTLGAIYGFGLAQIKVGAKSPIPGLVFAGSCTHGAGVEAVMISGAEAAEALVPGLLASEPEI